MTVKSVKNTENPDQEHSVKRSWSGRTYRRYLQNLYKVKTMNHRPRLEINSPGAVFNVVIENWDEDVMDYVKAYKTVVLDQENHPLGVVYFEPNAPVEQAHIRVLFDKIRDNLEGAASVLICRNNAYQPFMPDEKEKQLASSFRKYGARVHIPVIDQYVVSPMGMYKFQTEDYL